MEGEESNSRLGRFIEISLIALIAINVLSVIF